MVCREDNIIEDERNLSKTKEPRNIWDTSPSSLTPFLSRLSSCVWASIRERTPFGFLIEIPSHQIFFPAWKARITSAHLHLVCVVSLTPTTWPTCHRGLLNENHEGEKKQWVRTVGQIGVKSCRPRVPKSQESKPDTVGDHKAHLTKRRRTHESQAKLSRACSY